jgi:hypothetical protein
MAEQWIDAATALELGGNRFALCSRLHQGLLTARARLLSIGSKQTEHALIPKEFWWATGHEALDQDWEVGDFSTWIDRREHWQAFGVSFALNGVLEMLPFDRRALTAYSLSVAGNQDWLPARDARQLVYGQYGRHPMQAAPAIIEMAKLGFIAGRAVLFQGVNDRRNHTDWDAQEREWDIPGWFWSGFTFDGQSAQDWETGGFSGNGLSPTGLTAITLSGVHFQRASLAVLAPRGSVAELAEPSNRGRKRKYDWDAAATAVWGQIFRAELIPTHQNDVERAVQRFLTKGDEEPSESTVRPYASRIWNEYEKQAGNSG